MLILLNDKTGTITLAGLDILDCVLIRSALIGVKKHSKYINRIDRLIEICDPAIEIVLNAAADMPDLVNDICQLAEQLPEPEPKDYFDFPAIEADSEIEIDWLDFPAAEADSEIEIDWFDFPATEAAEDEGADSEIEIENPQDRDL